MVSSHFITVQCSYSMWWSAAPGTAEMPFMRGLNCCMSVLCFSDSAVSQSCSCLLVFAPKSQLVNWYSSVRLCSALNWKTDICLKTTFPFLFCWVIFSTYYYRIHFTHSWVKRETATMNSEKKHQGREDKDCLSQRCFWREVPERAWEGLSWQADFTEAAAYKAVYFCEMRKHILLGCCR